MSHKLQSAKLNFGIPAFASDNGFSTKMILRGTLYVKTEGGSTFVAYTEARGRNIFPNQVVGLPLAFESPDALDNIEFGKVESLQIIIELFEAQGGPEAQNRIRFRTEAVLVFDGGNLVVSPYPDPAPDIWTGLNHRWDDTYTSDRFSDEERLIDGNIN